MERADEPSEEGTPINKVLFDSINTDLNTRLLKTSKASDAEVRTGSNDDKYVTPLKLKNTYRNYSNLVNKYNLATLATPASQSTGNYIPAFTSSTTPEGFSVSSSTPSAGASHPYRAVDNSDSTCFETVESASGSYWLIELDKPILVKEITMITYSQSDSSTNYKGIWGSIDGENYELLGVQSFGNSSSPQTKTWTISGNKKYKFFKVKRCNSTGGDASNNVALRIYAFKITKWYEDTNYNQLTLANSALTAYETGMRVMIQVPSGYVGGGLKLNINSLGYKNVILPETYNIAPNKCIPIRYNGTAFELDEINY